VDNTGTINILSLCTGYGGLEIGLSRALEGIFRVVAVEIEAFALANLAAKTQEGKLAVEAMWSDLKTFPAERFRGCFDFIVAGYPCQPESVAGKRLGKDDPRYLWPDIERIIKAVRPVWCFFENVPGHLNGTFPSILRSLRDMGYKVEAGLFTAAECGAPHRRQRLFILANDTKSRGRRLSIRRRRQEQASIDIDGPGKISPACEAVADAKCPGPGNGTIEKAQTGSGGDRSSEQCPVMADTAVLGIQGSESKGSTQAGRQIDQQSNEQSIIRYPARPGQYQYEWEEPRIVGNTRSGISRTRRTGRARKSVNEGFKGKQQQAQSRLGGAVDGHSGRVDRLRLLGNGVVPQQAELAFRELIKQYC
jgi:site-specific DNA-cytosine methylase